MRESNKNYKVIFIFRSCGKLSGTERNLLNLCKFIDTDKVNIVICTQDGEFRQIFKEHIKYINFIDFPFDNYNENIRGYLSIFNFFRKIRAHKIIWLYNGVGCFNSFQVFISRIATNAHIYIWHHNYLKKFKMLQSKLWLGFIPGFGFWRIKKNVNLYISHLLAKKILVISPKIKEQLIQHWKIPAYKIRVGGRGVDTELFKPNKQERINLKKEFGLSEDTKILIAVNRLCKQKRVDRLLGAFLLLLKFNYNVRLLIFGDGEQKASYKARIMRNSLLRNNVVLMGFKQNIARYIQGSDFLLLASDFEGEVTVVKEAMGCGILPITTDSPGTSVISSNIFIAKCNVFDLYNKIKLALSIPEEERVHLAKVIVNEINSKFSLRNNCLETLSYLDIPNRINDN